MSSKRHDCELDGHMWLDREGQPTTTAPAVQCRYCPASCGAAQAQAREIAARLITSAAISDEVNTLLAECDRPYEVVRAILIAYLRDASHDFRECAPDEAAELRDQADNLHCYDGADIERFGRAVAAVIAAGGGAP